MDKYEKIAVIFLAVLVLLSLATQYSGSTDIQEYTSVAKFFSGEYNAKIRAGHSMLYSFLHFPLISLFQGYFVMKLTSLIFLLVIIISVYYISGKDKRALLLTIASPIIWYMGPWISPIQLSSLLFLWGFFFLNKYNVKEKKSYLLYSGILLGLSWAFWNTILFILFFLIICFFYDKKINHFLIFIFSVILGLLPLLILDQILFGMFFYSTLRYAFGILVVLIYGGIYPGLVLKTKSLVSILLYLIMVPVYSYTLFKNFKQDKKPVIFLLLVFLFFLLNAQIRYILIFLPILLLYLTKSLSKKQFKIQLIVFIILSLLVINPYLIQIKYSTNTRDFSGLIYNFGNWKILENKDKLILQDLEQIGEEYPNSVFVVGNKADDYAILAYLYLGNNVKEFVSIQDYNLFLQGDNTLFEKKIKSKPIIADRRQIWIGGGLEKSENDKTDYPSISLGIGLDKPINLDNFELIKKYKVLYLSKKIALT